MASEAIIQDEVVTTYTNDTAPINETQVTHVVTWSTWRVIFEFVVPGVLLSTLGLLGLLGNFLSIFVLSRPQMRSSINCMLIGKRVQLFSNHLTKILKQMKITSIEVVSNLTLFL